MFQRIIYFCLVFCLIFMRIFVVQSQAVNINNIKVEDLLKAKFKRIAGKEYREACLDKGSLFSWSNYSRTLPTVYFDGETYRMWFSGESKFMAFGKSKKLHERIGLAISKDGINWKLANKGKPVFDIGPKGSFDSKAVSHPFVLKVGDKYMMWYGGSSDKKSIDLGYGQDFLRIEQVGLAISNDGIHWKRLNNGKPVLKIGGIANIDSRQATGMHIIKKDDQFIMWYGAYNGKHTIGAAVSKDGINWVKINGGKKVKGLIGDEQVGPSVYFDGQKYFMLYSTIWKKKWTMFAAISEDGINWQPVFNGKPVLSPTPDGNFGAINKGGIHSAHPSQIIFSNGQILVWYGAEEDKSPNYQRIGLMEIILSKNE